jgi:hypothetical protein
MVVAIIITGAYYYRRDLEMEDVPRYSDDDELLEELMIGHFLLDVILICRAASEF